MQVLTRKQEKYSVDQENKHQSDQAHHERARLHDDKDQGDEIH